MALKYSTELGTLDRMKNDLAFRVRRRIFETFMRECAPGPDSRVADFGVSGHRDHPVHYFFETLYPHRSRLTVIGREAEEAGWFAEEFPGLTFLEADLRSIPLPTGYFDYGICNAVVEHGGPRDQQRALVAEVCRVSRCVLFTTPNKRFPVELHTFLPLIHWLPGRELSRHAPPPRPGLLRGRGEPQSPGRADLPLALPRRSGQPTAGLRPAAPAFEPRLRLEGGRSLRAHGSFTHPPKLPRNTPISL